MGNSNYGTYHNADWHSDPFFGGGGAPCQSAKMVACRPEGSVTLAVGYGWRFSRMSRHPAVRLASTPRTSEAVSIVRNSVLIMPRLFAGSAIVTP